MVCGDRRVLSLAGLGIASWRIQDEIDRLDAAKPVSAKPVQDSPVADVRTMPTPAELDGLAAAWRIHDALGHPWNDVFASLESSTPPGVSWVGFDHSADTGKLRLEGGATKLDGIFEMVDQFASKDLWQDVVLTGWEQASGGVANPAAVALTFRVEARIASRGSAVNTGQVER